MVNISNENQDNEIINQHNETILDDFNKIFSNYTLDLFLKEIKKLDIERFKEVKKKNRIKNELKTDNNTENPINEDLIIDKHFMKSLDEIKLNMFEILNQIKDSKAIPDNVKSKINSLLNFFIKLFSEVIENNDYIFLENNSIIEIVLKLKKNTLKLKNSLPYFIKPCFFKSCLKDKNKENFENILKKIKKSKSIFNLIFNLKSRFKPKIIQQKIFTEPNELEFNNEKLENSLYGFLLNNFPNLKEKVKYINKTETVYIDKPVIKVDNSINYLKLGEEYYYGITKNLDYLKSIELFEKSIEVNNNIEAYNYLGIIHLKGKGVKIDIEKAIGYFEICSNYDNKISYYYLGKIFEKNILKLNDSLKISFDYYVKSANLKYSKGLIKLGYYHENGLKCEQNDELAIKCYKEAINLNSFKAMNYWAKFLIKIKSQDKKYIFNLINNSYNMGYRKSIFSLGICYFKGIYVKSDILKAKNYFKESLKYYPDDHNSLFFLGYLKIKKGLKIKKKKYFIKAFNYLNSSISINNNSETSYYLGFLYENGLGCDSNICLSTYNYKKSVELSNYKNPKAMFKLATLYYSNKTENTKNNYIIIDLLKRSSELNDKDSANLLGLIYQNGDISLQDLNKAIDYFNLAIKLKHPSSKFNLFMLLKTYNLDIAIPLDSLLRDSIINNNQEAISYIKNNNEIILDIDENKQNLKTLKFQNFSDINLSKININ